MSQLRGEFCSPEQRSSTNPPNSSNNIPQDSLQPFKESPYRGHLPQQDSLSISSHSSSCDYTVSSSSSKSATSISSELKDLDEVRNTAAIPEPENHSDFNNEASSDLSLAEDSEEGSGLSDNGEVNSDSNTCSTSGSSLDISGEVLKERRNIHRSKENQKQSLFSERVKKRYSGREQSTSFKSQLKTTTTYTRDYYTSRGTLARENSALHQPGVESAQIRRIQLLRRFDNFLRRMSVVLARYHKELCIIFIILASGLASLRTTPAKIKPTSLPLPFFDDRDASYFIQDNYMGEYVDLANKEIPYHPSFLFYYAPWDSESVASRAVFLDVAKHFYFAYHGRVKFYAINCWWPGGQCKKNYKNLSHYPIFVAHVGKPAGIIYNGPIRTQPMVKFLNSLLKPVTRIDTEEELWRFRAQHDVIMLGYFNFTQKDSVEAYETYLQMSLRTFEADPFNQVGFGLFLRPELAQKFFLSTSNAISLVLFNEIHTAKWHGGYHKEGLKGPIGQVAEWVLERTKEVPITWVYALRNGFANRPAALGPQDFAQQLSKGPVFLLVSRRYFPSGHSPFYMQVKEVALDYFNCNRSGNVTKLRRTAHKINSEWASIWGSVVEICQRKGSFQCQQMMSNIHHWLKKRALFKRDPLQHYENISAAINFTGLSCMSERQFRFLAIDPVDVPYFINLGLAGLKNSDDTQYSIDPMAFIIDSQNDVIIPLPSLNITDIALTIHNYTLASEYGDVDALSTQLFLNNNRNTIEAKHIQVKNPTKQKTFETWGSSDLLEYVKGSTHKNSSVLLLYTASFCGHCAVAVTHIVALSRFLEENYGKDTLKVKLVAVDMFKNSLPPLLNPGDLPTVIFIPNWNRTDIKMYPENQEISSRGLLRFVLSELEPSIRVQASLMSPPCDPNNKYCTKIQSEEICSSDVSSNSTWRRSNSTGAERSSCIKSSRNSVSSQIELLLQKLQNGEEAMFDSTHGTFQRMTTQAWNGQLLDRLRTMAVTLDVS